MDQPTNENSDVTVTRSVRVAAPREVVFAVLTEPTEMGQWFGQSADFPDGVTPGAEGTFSWTEHGSFPARIERYEPVGAFAFRWGTPGEPIREDNSTTATFILEEEGEATLVTVTETGYEAITDSERRRAAMDHTAQGWTEELADLLAHAEALTADPGTGVRPQIDVDAGRIVRTVLVRAPQQTTWEALTDPEAIARWWGHPADFPDGISAGAEGTFEWVGHGLMPMRVERFEAPTAFDLLWGDLGDQKPGPDASLVEFRLHAAGPGRTLVSVCENGFRHLEMAERRAAMEENVTGWTKVLDALVGHIETPRSGTA